MLIYSDGESNGLMHVESVSRVGESGGADFHAISVVTGPSHVKQSTCCVWGVVSCCEWGRLLSNMMRLLGEGRMSFFYTRMVW